MSINIIIDLLYFGWWKCYYSLTVGQKWEKSCELHLIRLPFQRDTAVSVPRDTEFCCSQRIFRRILGFDIIAGHIFIPCMFYTFARYCIRRSCIWLPAPKRACCQREPWQKDIPVRSFTIPKTEMISWQVQETREHWSAAVALPTIANSTRCRGSQRETVLKSWKLSILVHKITKILIGSGVSEEKLIYKTKSSLWVNILGASKFSKTTILLTASPHFSSDSTRLTSSERRPESNSFTTSNSVWKSWKINPETVSGKRTNIRVILAMWSNHCDATHTNSLEGEAEPVINIFSACWSWLHRIRWLSMT